MKGEVISAKRSGTADYQTQPNSTVDFSILSYASAESTQAKSKSSEVLKAELQVANRELTSMRVQWQDEKRQLLGNNAALQDTANRLNHQVQDVKERAEQKERRNEKARSGILGVCDSATRFIIYVLLMLPRIQIHRNWIKRSTQLQTWRRISRPSAHVCGISQSSRAAPSGRRRMSCSN